MAAKSPEEICRLFQQHMAAGVLDALVNLYDPEAVFLNQSGQFRHFMPALADRWRLLAPDYPGFGYSGTPDPTQFAYTFDGYADFLERFAAAVNAMRYALYLHDYGSQIGLRLAIRAPERVAAPAPLAARPVSGAAR
jgi:pimeloyl-ACP methyl ester carboxylesterase